MNALIVPYLLFLLYAAVRLFRPRAQSAGEYIIMGRRLTLPAFVASLVVTWYGGILGVGEYTWRHGISNWLVFGVPYYLYAALFAVYLARRARRSLAMTIPDQLHTHYGLVPALTGAAVVLVMTAPAAYVLMIGVLVQFATGWPLWVGIVLGTVLSISYVFRGGLRAVVGTDIVQFCLMYLAFLVLVPTCIATYGGWDFLRAEVPVTHWDADGGRGWQAVAVWYFIALATLVEPAFYQRCYAAKTERTAQRGVAISIVFWVVFDFLTTTAGLYARAVLPDLADPVAAFPTLAARTLPGFWHGVFVVGLLATIMSTVDSYALIGAVTIGRDIVGRWRARRGNATLSDDETLSRSPMRWGLAVTAAVACALALWSGSVIELWHHLGSVGTPVLLLPLALSHTSIRAPAQAVIWSMAFSGTASLAWLTLAGKEGMFLGIEPIFPGLLVSVAILGPTWWKRHRQGVPQKPVGGV